MYTLSKDRTIGVAADSNLTGVVWLSAQENSGYQETVVQGAFTPAQARALAAQLEDAANRVDGEQVWCENELHPHKPHILVSACVHPHFSGRYPADLDRSVEDDGLASWERDLLNGEPPF